MKLLLLESKPRLQIVFVTTYGEYAVKAFELNALDYVLKPVRLDRLKLTVHRIQSRIAERTGANAASGLWSIQLFGGFTMRDGQGKSRTVHFRTTKAQELFFFLLHHRGKPVHKEQLMELLWPDMEITKASSQLYSSVYLIRKTMDPFGDRFLLQNVSDGYVLHLKDIVLDADEFEMLLKTEAPLSEDAAAELERKLKTIKGEYFEPFDYPWAEYERHRYAMQWIRLMLQLVNWCCEHQKYEKAMQLCDNLCSRYPHEEEAQLMYLKICDKLGFNFLVQRQYQLYASLLENEFGEKPGAEMTRWYHDWERRKEKE